MPVDTNKPVEILLFDFLTEQIAAAVPDEVLYELELHDTVFQAIKTKRGVRISDVVSQMAPSHDGSIKEFDVNITLACYAKVEGTNKKERQDAMTAVWNIQKEMYR